MARMLERKITRNLSLPVSLDERVKRLAPSGEISEFCRMAIASVVRQLENELEPKPNE